MGQSSLKRNSKLFQTKWKKKNTTFHNLWHIVETVFKEKHTALILILEKKKDLKSII